MEGRKKNWESWEISQECPKLVVTGQDSFRSFVITDVMLLFLNNTCYVQVLLLVLCSGSPLLMLDDAMYVARGQTGDCCVPVRCLPLYCPSRPWKREVIKDVGHCYC